VDERSVDRAGAPDSREDLLEAADAALRLLDRIDAHAPEGLAFGGEARVRKQLRAAIRHARNDAEGRAWADAEDPDEAAALDDLRAALGRMPSDGERAAYLAGYRQRRAQLLGRVRGWEAPSRA
jgi:hypothetical protein